MKYLITVAAVLFAANTAFANALLVCQSTKNSKMKAVVQTTQGPFGGYEVRYGNLNQRRILTGSCFKSSTIGTYSQRSVWKLTLSCGALFDGKKPGGDDPFPAPTNISIDVMRNMKANNYALKVWKTIKIKDPKSDPLFPDYKFKKKSYDWLNCKKSR